MNRCTYIIQQWYYIIFHLCCYIEADHAIDIPDSEADQFISMKKWFAKYV